jgi:hypothetical protein
MKVCVCVYVCPVACRRTHTSHHPEIWQRLLISPWLGTEPGGDPKCRPPGVPPLVTPSAIPWRVKNWAGASKQKLLLRVGLYNKILFVGCSPQPRAPRVVGPLDQSARDYFTMKLWNCPGQRRVAQLVENILDFSMPSSACVCVSGGLLLDLHNQSTQNLAWAPHLTLARNQARGGTGSL